LALPVRIRTQAGLERVTTSGRENSILSVAAKTWLPTPNSKEPEIEKKRARRKLKRKKKRSG